MDDATYTMYSDGGARGNPGPAGIGAVIKRDGQTIATVSESIGEATNNQAEYRAIIAGLQRAKELGIRRIDCYVDSELVATQLNRQARVKNAGLAKLFVLAWNLITTFASFHVYSIPREENTEADRLVNQALDRIL